MRRINMDKYGMTYKWVRRYMKTKAALLLACVFLAAVGFTACGDDGSGRRIIFTTGFSEDDIFRIDSISCTVPELMVYLTNTGNQYESVYGPEVWNISLGDVTLEENVKETVLAKIAQIKTMDLLAQDRDVALDKEEISRVEQAAAEYFASLNEAEKELMGVDYDIIEQLYREYALADKLYQFIIQDVNPEISDDEARTITVQHILLRTYTTDGAGRRIVFSDKVKQTVYDKAREILELALDGEHDFVDLASRYSEDTTITYSFGKGEMDAAFEEEAFSLETGEISRIIETEAGYHIIKCISTFDREQTDLNKLLLLEERRREVFGQQYDAFVETLVRQLNTKRWEEVTLLHNDAVTTTGFFEAYAKYFPDSGR